MESDVEELAKFCAINMTKEEITNNDLDDILPKRQNKIGMTNQEMTKKANKPTPSICLLYTSPSPRD